MSLENKYNYLELSINHNLDTSLVNNIYEVAAIRNSLDSSDSNNLIAASSILK